MKGSPLIRSAFVVALVLAVSSVWASEPSDPEGVRSGWISGVVTSEVTRQPLAGVLVFLETGTGDATTDTQGRFRIDSVPIGTHRLLLTRAAYLSLVVTDVVVTVNRETPVSARIQEVPRHSEEVKVTASYFSKPAEVTTGSFAMDSEEVRRSPGALGDVGRMLQALPGLAARDDQSNDIIARGGSPAENLILVDNLEVPTISHFGAQGATGGPITMLNPELIDRVDFMAGGFPAMYGNRLSSVMDVGLREGNRDRFAAEFDLGMAGAGLVLEGPLGGRGSWVVSGRRSYLELIAGAFGLTAVPEYSNYQAKAVYDLGQRNKLSLVSLGGLDTIHFDVDNADLDDVNTMIVDDRGWRTTSGLNWQSLLGSDGVGTFSVGYTASSFQTDVWDTRLGDQLVGHNRSLEGEGTGKYDLTYRLRDLANIRTGVYGKRFSASLNVSSPLGQQNPLSTDPARVNAFALDQTLTAWQGGGYLQVNRELGRVATATVGGRYDYFDINRSSALAPRAGLTFHLHRKLDFSATYGQYHQLPPLLFMKVDPTNIHLKPIRSDHYVTGLAFYPRSDLKLTVEAYHKRYHGYPVSSEYPTVTLANAGGGFEMDLLLAPMVSEGEGRGSGIEFYLQKKLSGRLWGQVSYAYSRTEQKALDGIWRPSSFDLRHAVAVVAGCKLSRRFEVSSKFSYNSGRPNTPFLPESTEQNRAILDTTRINAERMPAYHRLDLRSDYRHPFKWGSLVAYLELDNVYNRENVGYYLWNPKLGQRQMVPQVSFMSIGGVVVEF